MLSPDKITVGRAAVAYGLAGKEMVSLIDAIGAIFHHAPRVGPMAIEIPIGDAYSHNIAFECAKKHVNEGRIDRFISPEFWGNIKSLYGFAEDDSIYNYYDNALLHINTTKYYKDFGDNVLIDGLACNLEFIVMESALLEKHECIKYMHLCGYTLKKEVKGINFSLIDYVLNMVGNINIVCSSTNAQHKTQNKIQSFSESNVSEWEKVLPLMKSEKHKSAILFSIEKWRGKSHTEAYRAIYPNKYLSNMKSPVSRLKKTAEEIAQEYGLPMPAWRAK